MRFFYLISFFLINFDAMSGEAETGALNKVPIAKKVPFEMVQHGDTRTDNYYWLRDDSRSSEALLAHLSEENRYTDQWFQLGQNYKAEILKELLDQIPEEEISITFYNGKAGYFSKMFRGNEHPIYFQKFGASEKVIFDPNAKAHGKQYYEAGIIEPSPSNARLALYEDMDGRRRFAIRIISLSSNNEPEDLITGTSGNVVWSSDSDHFFYVKKDPITLIANSVYLHRIGTSQEKDKLIFQEKDQEFDISISRSASTEYLLINSESTDSNEYYFINLSKREATPRLFLKRKAKHLYYLEHYENSFYLRSNLDAPNFKLLATEDDKELREDAFEEIVPHRKDTYLKDFLVTRKFFITEVYKDGLPAIAVRVKGKAKEKFVDMPGDTYSVSLMGTKYLDYNKDSFYFRYSSLNQVPTIFQFDSKKLKKQIVWEKQVPNFNSADYVVLREFYRSRDGTQVPASLVMKKGSNSKNPILFYGYGSYGLNSEAEFRETIIPLLKRGFVFCILHVRGGGELGRDWYENGRMHKKLNTFYDFNDGVEEIIARGFGAPDKIFAMGGSAGGLLMGAIANLEPSLYKGIIASVPFMDVLTTMSDPSIPLTTFEYDEWGDPSIAEDYFYIKSYSPYDNIKRQAYPAMYVSSSLFDSQVQYFEPAKYVAKLREYNVSAEPILLRMNMIGGHSGGSGSINALREIAEEQSFLFRVIGNLVK